MSDPSPDLDIVKQLLDKAVVHDDPPPPSRFRFLDPAELDEMLDTEYIVEDVLAPGDLMVIWGDAKAGKTFVVLDFCASLVLGKPFIGKQTHRRVKVVYATAEGRRGIKHRMRGLAKQHGVSLKELKDWFKIVLDLPNLHKGEGVEEFFAMCKAFGAEVVILDTFARATSGMDENTTKDMNPALERLDPFQKEGMAIILPHHANRMGKMRGSSGLDGTGDIFLQVKKSGDGRRSLAFDMAKDTVEFPEMFFSIVPAPGADNQKEVAVEWLDSSSTASYNPDNRQQTKARNRAAIIEYMRENYVGSGSKRNPPDCAVMARDIHQAVGTSEGKALEHLQALAGNNTGIRQGLRRATNGKDAMVFWWDETWRDDP